MNADAAIPSPIIIKTAISFSIAFLISNLVVLAGIIYTMWQLVLKHTIHGAMNTPVSSDTVVSVMCIAIEAFLIYGLIGPIICNEQIIPIYGSATIANPAMVDNILARFSNKTSVWARVQENLKHPAWSTEFISLYNQIIMTFYKTTQLIGVDIHSMKDNIGSIQNSCRVIHQSQGKAESDMNTLRQDQLDMKERQQRMDERLSRMEERQLRMEERQQRMDERLSRMEDKLDKMLNMLSRFAFVVEESE